MASDGCSTGKVSFQGFLSRSLSLARRSRCRFTALADGGQVRSATNQTLLFSAFRMLEDRFGVGWMIGGRTPEQK